MKKYVSISLALMVLFSMWGGFEAKAQSYHFSDIQSGHEIEKQINYLVKEGIISGYPDGTFRPDHSVTRREAAVVIGKTFNLHNQQRKTSFSDVNSKDYASGYIQSAYEAGIIKGYGDGTFRPDRNMTRGEMSYLLSKAFKFLASQNFYFTDVNPFSHSYDVINKLANNGVTIGYPDDTFRPDRVVTRGEFALFVSRSLEENFRVEKDQSSPGKRIIKADWLNVRKGPGTDYASSGLIKYGTMVDYYFKIEKWAFIKGGGYEGFVYAPYLGVPISVISGKTITVDPGHGFTDPGASGNGLVEKEVVLSVGKKLRGYLEKAGAKVVMTRTDDSTYPSLSERIDIAEESHSDSFISIHANKFHNDAAHGTETYYNSSSPKAAESKKLATYIQNRLYKAIDTSNRGVKDGNYHVIRENSLTSVLVELGFLSNPSDARKLASDVYRERAAEAIYLGILDYYKNKQ